MMKLKKTLKNSQSLKIIYTKWISVLRAYFPRAAVKISYFISYGKRINLIKPESFKEKLLWLSLNTYKNNKMIFELSDKYLARKHIAETIGEEYLNELYNVWSDIKDISVEKLPNSFVIKRSQGCSTNILCSNKNDLDASLFYSTLRSWGTEYRLYDKTMADIGGISFGDYQVYYVCEKYLEPQYGGSLIDYKFYCFNGIPRAILVIGDRFNSKAGIFMSPKWQILQDTAGDSYQTPDKTMEKPKSLENMLDIAKKLSEPFPFVRVDLYEVDDKPVFGEMTFFPNAFHTAESMVDGVSMGDLLDISKEMNDAKK